MAKVDHELPLVVEQGVCATAADSLQKQVGQGAGAAQVDRPQWQATAGQCNTGAHAGQPAAQPAAKEPSAEQVADQTEAAMNGGSMRCAEQAAARGAGRPARVTGALDTKSRKETATDRSR